MTHSLRLSFLGLLLAWSLAPAARSQNITTVAGGGATFAGAPLSLPVGYPYAITPADSSGNYYIAASGSGRIFKINAAGQMSLFAGTGTAGAVGNGDGGPAVNAVLGLITDLALDKSGNVYLADSTNDLIRMVNVTTNIITTVVGHSCEGSCPLGDGGPATSANLDQPYGVAVDGTGNIYVADTFDDLIRVVNTQASAITIAKVTIQPGDIETVAGNSSSIGCSPLVEGVLATTACLEIPGAVALDTAGDIFLSTGETIQEINKTTGIINDVAGTNGAASGYTGDGALATSAKLGGEANGLSVDASGNIFIADSGNNVIREVTKSNGFIYTVAGLSAVGTAGFSGDGGAAASAELNEARSAVVDSADDIFIADLSNNRIREVTNTAGTVNHVVGNINTVAGNGWVNYDGDGVAATSTDLDTTSGVAVDSAGNLFIVDQSNQAIREVAANTGIITTVAGNGEFANAGDGTPAASAAFCDPQSLALDPAGNVYIADPANEDVLEVSAGIINRVAGEGFPPQFVCLDVGGYSGAPNLLATNAALNSPYGVARDASGDIFIADSGNNLIRRVDAVTGYITNVAGNETAGYTGEGTATSVELNAPSGVALDSTGNFLFIADTDNHRIREVNLTTGIISTVAGNGTYGYTGEGVATSVELNFPYGVAVDSSGNIFIADTFNNRVREVNLTTGTISTVAGNGTYGYNSDGILATTAWLADPQGVAVDSSENLYIADSSNSRIRLVPVGNPAPTLTSLDTGSGILGQTLNVVLTGTNFVSGVSSVSFGSNINVNTTAVNSATQITVNITIASDATVGAVDVSVTNSAPGGGTATLANGFAVDNLGAQTITFGAMPGTTYGAGAVPLAATASSGLPVSYTVTGPATISGSTLSITGAGAVTVTAAQAGNGNYAAATSVSQSFTVAKATLAITASSVSVPYNQAIPALTGYTPSGFVNGDTAAVLSGTPAETTTATQGSPAGTYPITLTQGTLAATNYNFTFVSGTLTISGGLAQTITFGALPGTTYGAGAVPLAATASSGLPVSYAVTGPATLSGSTLSIIGAGAVTVTAAQAGSGNYAAATSVSQSFTVAKATLAITASSVSVPYNQAIPALTGYTPSGFVNGDTAAVLSGTPAETTTATQGSPAGTYPITLTQGTLAATNYNFTFVSGTLTISGGLAQTITFGALPGTTYGAGAVPLAATASSGLPVSYTVTGPATISGSTLSITGAGAVTVTAAQAGNGNYAAATSVSQSFTVAKATLAITASSVSVPYNQAIPALTSYTPSGFVNGDTAAVLSGTPAETTTATQGSPAGTYPITLTQGTLAATNYNFTFVSGTLTISGGLAQTITFGALPGTTYGAGAVPLAATASSGLPVSYAVTGPATLSGSTLSIIGAGAVTVTAAQAGSGNYAAATSVSQSFTVAKATLAITASSVSVPYNQAIPALTGYTPSGFVNGDTAAVLSGTPAETTTATQGSPAGTYPITLTQGTLAATNYNFTFVSGTLTISGGLAQTITFGALPGTTYGAGAVPLAATASSGLPVSYTVTGPATISGSTLSITGAGAVTVTAAQAGNGNYAAATSVSQSFTVAKATLAITASSVSVPYNQTIPALTGYTPSGFVNGDTAAVLSGSPAETTTATQGSPAGTYPITLTQGTLAATNYNFTFVSGTLTISGGKINPVITWAPPAEITYGTSLSAAQLDAIANVAGKFVYTPAAGTILKAGSQTLAVTFTPTNTSAYNTVTATVTLIVNQAIPPVIWLPIPISYGVPLGPLQLDALTLVPGTFTYTPAAGTVLGAGQQKLSAVFTPHDSLDFETIPVQATLEIIKAVPRITWGQPASITAGTPLGAAQLNATANVPGTFVYSPPAGTKLATGNWTLTVTFTPSNGANYQTVNAEVDLTVKSNH